MISEAKISSLKHDNETNHMKAVPRCLELFKQGIKSQETYKIYKLYLDKFFEWSGKDYESLLMVPPNELQELLEEYLFYLKKKIES